MTPFERRAHACQEQPAGVDADATMLFPSRNLLYLSGFDEEPAEHHLLLFVPRKGAPALLVPDLYETQIRAESWVANVRTWSDDDGPRDAPADIVSSLSLAGGRVLVDDTMWMRLPQDLRVALPDANLDLASEVVTPLRAREGDAELGALRRAGATAGRVVEHVHDMDAGAVDTTENELTAEIKHPLMSEGDEGIPFGPSVGSGPNNAMPHHSHGDRIIGSGDPVVLDFGAVVDHYPNDQTRTIVFTGKPPAEFAEVHGVIQAARTAAVKTVKPGVTADDVDRAAREVIEEASYGDHFIHRTGHGVSLDVHEEPYTVAESDHGLEVGNVFGVEPGVYLSNEFGVRIEDLIVVTGNGAELLNNTSRGWRY